MRTTCRHGSRGGTAARRAEIAWAAFRGVAGVLFLAVAAGCSEDNGPADPPPTDDAPRPASNLVIVATSPARIDLGWRDGSLDETGFRIERRTDPGGSFAEVDTVPAGVASYGDGTVTESAAYTYRIVSYKRSAEAAPSNEASALAVANQSPIQPRDPGPPDGTVELEPAASITLTWRSEDPDGEPLSHSVTFGASRDRLETVALASPSDTFVTVARAIEANTHYFWQVTAKDPKGVTRVSPVWGFTTKIDRVTIPIGRVAMGDSAQFLHPGSPVQVSDFDIDRFEVTNQQYADFLNTALDRRTILVRNGSVLRRSDLTLYAELRERDADSSLEFSVAESTFVVVGGRETFPMVEVTWFGADAYARFYNRRLPREREWEKAARGVSRELGFVLFAGTDTVGVGFPYPWGTEPEIARGNFSGSGDPFESQGALRATPVGFYDGSVRSGYQTLDGSSPYGVDDMAGNVWEWLDDWFGPYRSPHVEPIAGTERVLRGGSFNQGLGSAYTYNRSKAQPNLTDRSVGFRTAN